MPKSKPDSEAPMRLLTEDLCQRVIARLSNLPWREVNTLIGELHRSPKIEKAKRGPSAESDGGVG